MGRYTEIRNQKLLQRIDLKLKFSFFSRANSITTRRVSK